MKPDEPAYDEAAKGHAAFIGERLVVGIPHHEAREDEEEVHTEEAMIELIDCHGPNKETLCVVENVVKQNH